jgi:hypothetical protein
MLLLARARGLSQGVAPAGSFDIREYDFAANTGPRVALTDYADGTGLLRPAAVQTAKHFAPGGYDEMYLSGGGVDFTDCDVELPMIFVEAGGVPLARSTLDHCLVRPTMAKQAPLGSQTGAAVNGRGDWSYCKVIPAIDSLEGFGGYFVRGEAPSMVQYTWLTGRGYPYYYGKVPQVGAAPGTTLGRYLTDAEALALTTNAFSSGKVVAAGDMFQANIGGEIYYVVAMTSGTLGTSTTGWPTAQWDSLAPTATSQPFASGTATLAIGGPITHQDGVQWSTVGRTTLYRALVEGHGNSAAFIQSASLGREGLNVPVTAIKIQESILRAGPKGGTYWLYNRGTGSGDPDAPTYSPGGVMRSGGVWSINPNAYKGRPWGVQILDTWFTKSTDGTVPTIANGISTAGSAPDEAVYVHDEEQWRAGVAAELGMSTSADANTLDAMLDGSFDWSTITIADFDTAVLEQRWLNGLRGGGQCDARCWMPWSNNNSWSGDLNTPDVVAMHPTGWASKGVVGVDAQGYYTGV